MKSDKGIIYFIATLFLKAYFTLYHRVRFFGQENIPSDRTVIIAANHASYLDPPLVGYAVLPLYLKFIAWDRLFVFKPFGAFLRIMGALPVSQENKNSAAGLLKAAIGFLNEGYSLFICPEGHRTLDGHLSPLEGGVAIMSLKTGAPVIPTYVAGTWRALAPHMKFPRPYKLQVICGEPIDPKTLPADMPDKEKRRLILDKIMEFYVSEDKKDKKKYPLKA